MVQVEGVEERHLTYIYTCGTAGVFGSPQPFCLSLHRSHHEKDAGPQGVKTNSNQYIGMDMSIRPNSRDDIPPGEEQITRPSHHETGQITQGDSCFVAGIGRSRGTKNHVLTNVPVLPCTQMKRTDQILNMIRM